MKNPDTPLFPLELDRFQEVSSYSEEQLDQIAAHLAMSFAKVRAATTHDLMTTFKNISPFLPSRDYFSHEIERSRETISERCWKCRGRLERRPLGYYCPTCSRYRRVKLNQLHWKRKGGSQIEG